MKHQPVLVDTPGTLQLVLFLKKMSGFVGSWLGGT